MLSQKIAAGTGTAHTRSEVECVALGDRVQWTSAGVDQFPTPRQIVWMSKCGEWVQVEGSYTGIPTSELVVVERRSHVRDQRTYFPRFANVVVRDKRIAAATMVLLAYLSTIAGERGDFGLWSDALRKPVVRGRGFGRDVIARALREAKRLGFLDRPSNTTLARAVGGKFQRSFVRLRLPESANHNDGLVLERPWFDGNLTLNELATLLFLQAGPKENHSGTYIGDLTYRFSWSRPTARAAVAGLVDRGLITKRHHRRAAGTFSGVTYTGTASSIRRSLEGVPEDDRQARHLA
jgi:DNA-binding MarR family transcriptional regulator